MAEASTATTIHFPLPKRCADIRRGGVGEHGGGKRRHSSTARRARRVEEWRRLPPPCQAQPHLPPFVGVIKCRFPSQAASHLLGNGKTMDALHWPIQRCHSRGDGLSSPWFLSTTLSPCCVALVVSFASRIKFGVCVFCSVSHGGANSKSFGSCEALCCRGSRELRNYQNYCHA